jgi:hypothetical protein
MKKIIAIAATFAAAGASAWAAAFTAGDIVIYRVGTGSGALSNAATAVFLDEYTAAGTLVQSVAVDTTGTNRLTASGTATSEGMLTLSSNGSYLSITGYDAATGTSSIANTTATTAPREALVYGTSGTVTTKVTFGTSFSANNIRSAYTSDGTNVYAVGANSGVVYSDGNTLTTVSSTVTNLRTISVQGGQLYTSTGSGSTLRVGTVGTGVPTTTGQTAANLPGFVTSGSPYQFAFADLSSGVAGFDTLYVADDSSGIQKFSLVGGTWTLNNTITGASLRGLTLSVNAVTGAVSLFATGGSSSNTLYSLTDASGYNASMTGSLTTLATAGANTTFRGVAFTPGTAVNLVAVPEPTTTALGIIGLLGVVLAFRRKFARE